MVDKIGEARYKKRKYTEKLFGGGGSRVGVEVGCYVRAASAIPPPVVFIVAVVVVRYF